METEGAKLASGLHSLAWGLEPRLWRVHGKPPDASNPGSKATNAARRGFETRTKRRTTSKVPEPMLRHTTPSSTLGRTNIHIKYHLGKEGPLSRLLLWGLASWLRISALRGVRDADGARKWGPTARYPLHPRNPVVLLLFLNEHAILLAGQS